MQLGQRLLENLTGQILRRIPAADAVSGIIEYSGIVFFKNRGEQPVCVCFCRALFLDALLPKKTSTLVSWIISVLYADYVAPDELA